MSGKAPDELAISQVFVADSICLLSAVMFSVKFVRVWEEDCCCCCCSNRGHATHERGGNLLLLLAATAAKLEPFRRQFPMVCTVEVFFEPEEQTEKTNEKQAMRKVKSLASNRVESCLSLFKSFAPTTTTATTTTTTSSRLLCCEQKLSSSSACYWLQTKCFQAGRICWHI